MPRGSGLQVGDVVQAFLNGEGEPIAAMCVSCFPLSVVLFPNSLIAWRVASNQMYQVMSTPGYRHDDWVGSSLLPLSWEWIPRT